MSTEAHEHFDCLKAGERVSAMWMKLAERIAAGAEQMAVNDPVQAIRDACCAEACFWKATGESDTHDVKDIFDFPSNLACHTTDQVRG